MLATDAINNKYYNLMVKNNPKHPSTNNNDAVLLLRVVLTCWGATLVEGFGSGGFATFYQDTAQIQSSNYNNAVSSGNSTFYTDADSFETELRSAGKNCEANAVQRIIGEYSTGTFCPAYNAINTALIVAGGNETKAASALFDETLDITNPTESDEFYFNLDSSNTNYAIGNSTSPWNMYDASGCRIQVITYVTNSAGELDQNGEAVNDEEGTIDSVSSFLDGLTTAIGDGSRRLTDTGGGGGEESSANSSTSDESAVDLLAQLFGGGSETDVPSSSPPIAFDGGSPVSAPTRFPTPAPQSPFFNSGPVALTAPTRFPTRSPFFNSGPVAPTAPTRFPTPSSFFNSGPVAPTAPTRFPTPSPFFNSGPVAPTAPTRFPTPSPFFNSGPVAPTVPTRFPTPSSQFGVDTNTVVIGERSDPQCISERVAQVVSLKTSYDARMSESTVSSVEFGLALLGVIMGLVIFFCAIFVSFKKDSVNQDTAEKKSSSRRAAEEFEDEESGGGSDDDDGSVDDSDYDSDYDSEAS